MLFSSLLKYNSKLYSDNFTCAELFLADELNKHGIFSGNMLCYNKKKRTR